MVTLLISGLVCIDERGDELRCGLLENGLGERPKLVRAEVGMTGTGVDAPEIGPHTRWCSALVVAWWNDDAATAAGV